MLSQMLEVSIVLIVVIFIAALSYPSAALPHRAAVSFAEADSVNSGYSDSAHIRRSSARLRPDKNNTIVARFEFAGCAGSVFDFAASH